MGIELMAGQQVLVRRGDPLPFAAPTVRVCEPTDINRLSQTHWAEFHDHKPHFNWDYLKNATCIQAFDQELAVGYLFFYVFPEAHEVGTLAMVDLYYVSPAYRRDGVGRAMFDLAEQEGKKRGATRVSASYNVIRSNLDFFQEMGYSRTHCIVAKEI
jgi:GNAT superfamily N-acetyltransferase